MESLRRVHRGRIPACRGPHSQVWRSAAALQVLYLADRAGPTPESHGGHRMPGVIPFIPLISAGVAAGGTIAGAKLGSNAAQHASDTQAKATVDALEYQKQLATQKKETYDAAYADYRQRYAEYLHQFYGVPLPAAQAPGSAVHAMSTGAPGASVVPAGATIATMMAG